MFTTRLRQTDALVAEVVARHRDIFSDNEPIESPLTLSKVMYAASLSDMFSITSIPHGGTCSDFELDLNNRQDACVTGFPLSRPPLFNKHHGFAAGLKVRASNFAASLAELMCAPRNQLDPTSSDKILSTFGQISYQLLADTKLSISGVWQIPCSLPAPIRFDKVKNRGSHSKSQETESSSANSRQVIGSTSGSLCMVLDIDESTKFGGWVEVQRSNSSSVKWAASLSDMPEYDIGWGMTLGGSVEGQSNSVLLEGFLNFNVDRRGSLQPGLIFALNGRQRVPAVMLRTSWSL